MTILVLSVYTGSYYKVNLVLLLFSDYRGHDIQHFLYRAYPNAPKILSSMKHTTKDLVSSAHL